MGKPRRFSPFCCCDIAATNLIKLLHRSERLQPELLAWAHKEAIVEHCLHCRRASMRGKVHVSCHKLIFSLSPKCTHQIFSPHFLQRYKEEFAVLFQPQLVKTDERPLESGSDPGFFPLGSFSRPPSHFAFGEGPRLFEALSDASCCNSALYKLKLLA